MANLGLLFYRSGQYGQGRSYYADAISSAEKSGNHLLAALAATNHARESFLSGSAWANDVLAQARKISKRVVSPGIAQYLEKLEKVFRDPTSIGDTFGQGAVLAFELARAPTTASYTAQG